MSSLFDTIRELAEAKSWSAGVELSRNAQFDEVSSGSGDERVLRIVLGRKDAIVSVSLSEPDVTWQSDCGCEDDPCRHVVAALLALRQSKIGSSALKRGAERPASQVGDVVFSFARNGNLLSFERYLVFEDKRVSVTSTILKAITDLAGGQQRVNASDDELAIDHVLTRVRSGVLDPRTMRHLLAALARVRRVELDGALIAVGREPIAAQAEVIDHAGGYLLRRILPDGLEELFDNGAAVINGELRAVEDSSLSAEELDLLRGTGTVFSTEMGEQLATRIIPRLRAKIAVRINSTTLPRARAIAPRIEIEAVSDEAASNLTVIPRLVYGDPSIAEVRNGELILADLREIPIREPAEEGRLARELRGRLGLDLGRPRVFVGEQAVAFAARLRSWGATGDGIARFTPAAQLQASAHSSAGGLEIVFKSKDGGVLSAERAVAAWRRGSELVALDGGGGWALLPKVWLREHIEALERIIEASKAGGRLPPRLLPEINDICAALGVEVPDYFSKLREGLADIERIPDAALPSDLSAELRPYQRLGVNWINFLHSHGLGALIADDMGLGKTLQTLCALRGRVLVVCPTSVISSWREQCERFRPGLSLSVYHGARRELGSDSAITVTSYGLLRMDIAALSEVEWDTVVLDEAQMIRNPRSQVAQAAARLKAKYKIALSGTPVENSLDDLWSQCSFLNPGLLGSYSAFQERFADPIAAGDLDRGLELRRKVAPFILRRMKRDVARDLPPKTEVVVECELSEQERSVYEALLGSAIGDLRGIVSRGEGALSALEALLRLRQACCHRGLLPGMAADSSSKVELLIDYLIRSKANGHRALVFSQWTSLLDRIEPHLKSNDLSFVRIDGSTADRGSVVDSFQSDGGADLMLLSLKAGGVGLTLTAADHVYIVDPWWNPAVEDQAADRAYRIGQRNPVIVHRLVAKDTVEERILKLQESKRGLLSAALGAGGSASLSPSEILKLIES
jgi:hypothetical protein